MSILLPALRILDGHRFDAKFLELKARRASRTDEERIVEAGPMMLALNAKQEAPVKIPKAMLQEKELRKRIKKRMEGVLRADEREYKKAVREAVKQGLDPDSVPRPRSMREPTEGELEEEKEKVEEEGKMEVDELNAEAEVKVEPKAAPVDPAAEKLKLEKAERRAKRKAAAAERNGIEADDGSAPKKRKRDRHPIKDAVAEAGPVVEAAQAAPTPAATEVEAATTAPATGKAPRKRKAKAKDTPAAAAAPSEAATTPATSTEPADSTPRHRKRGRDAKNPDLAPAPRREREPSPPRPKKKKGGVLADLRGDPSAPSPAAPAPVPAPAAEVAPVAEAVPEKVSKAKTSVLKVVEVKRKAAPVVDVGSLLGLGGAQPAEDSPVGSGWD